MRANSLRRLAEILLGPIIIRRRLAPEHGGGLIVASARVGGLKCILKPATRWDQELLSVAERLVRKGDRVWDVGANIGLFSKAAAYRAGGEGQVLGIEADQDAVALLNRTRRHHAPGHAPITILPVVVSRSVGFIPFAISMRARASNSIRGFGSTQTGGVADVRMLPSVSLDSLLDQFSAPNVIKIDVEGAELEVLSGAEAVLKTVRPVIYCEVAAETQAEAISMLQKNGYKIFDGNGDAPVEDPKTPIESGNITAIPAEKLAIYS